MADNPAKNFDELGIERTTPAAPPAAISHVVGIERDPWLGTATRTMEPELLARLLRPDTDLSTRMALIKELARHPQVFTCMRNLINAVRKCPWEVQPFDDSAPAKKDADELRDFYNSFPDIKKLIGRLVWGELFPLMGSELDYADDYSVQGYTHIDPIRWTTNRANDALRLKTLRSKYLGEDIDRRGFIIHSSALLPGHWLEQGLWQVIGWLVLFEQSSWEYHLRFAETFGNPFIWAFYDGPENEEAAVNGIKALAGNARAAFPKTIEIKVDEAQRTSSSELYRTIRQDAQQGITKVIQGHMLNTDSESGSGTLAGDAAEAVSQANLEGVGEGLADTFHRDIDEPFFGWRRGWDFVKKQRLAKWILKVGRPEDMDRKAKTYVQVNVVLAASGRAIDPSQIEDEFGVKTVPLVRAPQPANGDPNADPNADPAQQDAKPSKKKVAASAARPPRISSPETLGEASDALIAKGVGAMGDPVLRLFDEAETIEAGIDALFEHGPGAIDSAPLVASLRDVNEAGFLIGRGDVDEEAGGGE